MKKTKYKRYSNNNIFFLFPYKNNTKYINNLTQ